jgi:dTDP-glucose 4,6-dehydratase
MNGNLRLNSERTNLRKFAILGGDGVFGNHFANYVLSENLADRVISIGRNPRKSEVYTLGVGKNDKRFRYYQVHILHELDILMKILDIEKPQCIINFAALAYATSWNDSYRYYDANLIALSKIVEIIKDKSYFEHWMQIGSAEVYGPAKNKPFREDDSPNPTSPYAVSKLAGDLHLKTYFDALDFPMNIIRPSNSYGPGQQLYRIIPNAICCAIKLNKLKLEGGGTVQKSYLHATDMSKAIYRILCSAPLGEIYNAGPELPNTILEIVGKIADALKIDLDSLIEVVPARSFEDSKYWLDSTKIKTTLNWEPQITLETGIDDMIKWAYKYLNEIDFMTSVYELRS